MNVLINSSGLIRFDITAICSRNMFHIIHPLGWMPGWDHIVFPSDTQFPYAESNKQFCVSFIGAYGEKEKFPIYNISIIQNTSLEVYDESLNVLTVGHISSNQ